MFIVRFVLFAHESDVLIPSQIIIILFQSFYFYLLGFVYTNIYNNRTNMQL